MESASRRMVKDERARQRHILARRALQLIAQLDRAKRVDARFHQRRVCVDEAAYGAPHHVKHRVQLDGAYSSG